MSITQWVITLCWSYSSALEDKDNCVHSASSDFLIKKSNLNFIIFSLRNCLSELKEQADSDGGFIGRTFEQLRELYATKYPQYFEQEDLDFEAPVKGHGFTEEDEKSRRLQVLKDFLAGNTKTIVWG